MMLIKVRPEQFIEVLQAIHEFVIGFRKLVLYQELCRFASSYGDAHGHNDK
jgi:hypothetical protein